MKVVWVLGAGFSRPLGGPLLTDLFSPRLHTQLMTRFEKDSGLRDALAVATSAYGTFDNAPGRMKADLWERPWTNAEEFLEFLDLATHDTVPVETRRQVQSQIDKWRPANMDFEKLADSVRRYFAAVCSIFLENAMLDSETWYPYRRWTRSLRAQDTVLTFNYDLVPEMLQTKSGRLRVYMPRESADAKHDFERGESPAAVIKLHGSVDWYDDGSGVKKAEPELLLRSHGPEIQIASPGVSKRFAVSKAFKDLWDLAEHRLEQADVVVFVGYRFPESDNEAKRRLLEAIGVAGRSTPVTVHIVLGPDTSHRDVRRLQGLLDWCLRQNNRVLPEAQIPPGDGMPYGVATIITQLSMRRTFLRCSNDRF